MALSSASLLQGATLSATGGTSKTYSVMGESIPNGKKLVDLTITDARLRGTVTCINRPSAYNASTGISSKGKRSLKLVEPKLLASGKMAFPLGEIRIEDHPEMTVAEVDSILTKLGQMCFDTDFRNFVLYGTLD